MKVLVTGATGFTGRILAQKLYAAGHQVKVFVCDRAKMTFENAHHMEVVESDIRDGRKREEAVADVDWVFHLAALYCRPDIPNQTYYDVNVQAVQDLLAAARSAGVKRFIHCSTVGVHGPIEEPFVDETYRFAPGDPYQLTKLEGEKGVLRFGREHDFSVSVVRPGPIYGPGDLRYLKLFRLAAIRSVPIPGNGKTLVNLVYVEDLVDLLILTAEKDEAVGEVFIGAGPESICIDELISSIATLLHRSSHIIHLPVAPFQLLGLLCEKLCTPFGIQPPVNRKSMDFFVKPRLFSSKKSRDVLGWEPQFGYQKGLASTVEWYRQEGLL